MPIAFSCSCGKSMQAKDAFAGRKLKCPQCGNVVRIPKADESLVADEEKAAPEPPPLAKPAVRRPVKEEDADEAPPLARPVAPSPFIEDDEEVDEAPPLAKPVKRAAAIEDDDPPLARPVVRAPERSANVWTDTSLTQRSTPWLPGDQERFQPGMKEQRETSLVTVLLAVIVVAGAIGAGVWFFVLNK